MPRVAVVTGAAQGIGRRTAQVLAATGYALVLVDVREPAEAAAELDDAETDTLSLVGDVAD